MAADANLCRSPTRKRYTILLSSFTNDEKESLAKKIKALGGSYVDTPHFIMSCTHIICSKPNRGEKFLCGCATGKWILTREYIEDSAKANSWLSEELYEWNNKKNYPGLSTAHISAPMRWRQRLQKEQGPFNTWKVLVVVGDAKRRVAYKRLLDAGSATILNGKSPYPAKMAKKLTHVFVEKALETDVKELINIGIPCLSPDYIPEYILQQTEPKRDAYSISNYTHLANVPTKKTHQSNKNTPILPLGMGGVSKTQSRIQDLITKCAMKRPAEVISLDEMSPTKKRKQEEQQDLPTTTMYPEWLDVPINNPAAIDVDMTKSGPVSGKPTVKSLPFTSHVSDAVCSYIEESHQRSALAMVESFLSHSRHPDSSLIYTLMNRILLKSASVTIANKAYTCLQRVLLLHPPPLMSELYLSAMSPPEEASNSQVIKKSNEWAFLSDVIRLSLGHREDVQIPVGGINPRQLKENSLLTLRFLVCLLEKDFMGIIVNGTSQCTGEMHQYDKSLVWRIMWPNGMGAAVNSNVRSLFKLTWMAAQESGNDDTKVQVLLQLQSLVAMVASCCQAADSETSPDAPNSSGAPMIGMRMASIATEVSLTCGRSHETEHGLKLFLETCLPAWLKMKVAQLLLDNYDHCLVPQESKHLLATALSMEKIISCYFYLLPRVAKVSSTETASDSSIHPENTGQKRRNTALRVIAHANSTRDHDLRNEQQSKKTRYPAVNRRNIRGETPLHVACIRSDAAKVRELIAHGADVNLVDNAGWTPLHEACNHGHVACVEEILKVRPLVYEIAGDSPGLHILSSPKCGTTALHDAAGNGHLEVARLLIEAGGLPMLEAKNSTGLRPVDVAGTCAVKQYLIVTEKNLRNKGTLSVNLTESRTSHEPSSEMYLKALGRRGRHAANYIAPEKCELYLLILSHLLKAYMQVYRSRSVDSSSVDNLMSHISNILSQEQLTPSCNLRLQEIALL